MWRSRARAVTLAAIGVMVALPAVAGAAQFTVNSTVDAADANTSDGVCAAAGGQCTLRAAVQQANVLTGADTVVMPAGTYPIASSLPLSSLITLVGPAGARGTVISGAPGTSVITINSSGVTVRGVTVTGGARGIWVQGGTDIILDQVAARGNGVSSATNLFAGGIFVGGTASVVLTRSLVAGNTLTSTSGQASGGGVYVANGGVLTAVATTIAGNVANSASGSGAFGGGVAIGAGGQATLRHVTLAGNSAPSASLASSGGNLNNGGQATVSDSIITGGQAYFGSNCQGSITAQGRNIDSGTTCAFGAGHLNSTDPQLLPLADHGGPTDSMTLATNSPARDQALACPAGGLDQRGAAAPSGSACDIGAVELSSDLGVTVQAAQAEATPGTDVTYLVRLTNAGMDAAPGAALDIAAGGATTTLASASTGTCTLEVRCQIGTLARGQEVTVTVVARAGTSPIAFSARASSGLPDPAPGNDVATLTTPVTGTTAPPPTGSEPPPAATPPPPALGRLRLVGRARTARVTRVATTLSAPATVTVTIDRLLPGRRVSGRCRAGARTGTRCTLVRRAGVVRQRAARGAVTLRIPARVRGRVLVPGRYRLRAVAADVTGQRSAARVLTIQVTR
jgi:CSLREA domain-containing protein